MRIVVLGAGMQGTLYGACLARVGHEVTFIARGRRAEQLRRDGAVIENAFTGVRAVSRVAVADALRPETNADLCLLTVRRDQLAVAWETVSMARGLAQVLIMVNQAGSVSRPLTGVTAIGLSSAFLERQEVSRAVSISTSRFRSSRRSSKPQHHDSSPLLYVKPGSGSRSWQTCRHGSLDMLFSLLPSAARSAKATSTPSDSDAIRNACIPSFKRCERVGRR